MDNEMGFSTINYFKGAQVSGAQGLFCLVFDKDILRGREGVGHVNWFGSVEKRVNWQQGLELLK